jgi:hypothetical protein
MAYQNTTNRSQRDINQKFNLVEFNKLFEQNNLSLNKKKDIITLEPKPELPMPTQQCPNKSQINIFFIIICIIISVGILLLLFNNFILNNTNNTNNY